MMVIPFVRRRLCKYKPNYRARRKTIQRGITYIERRIFGGSGRILSVKCRNFSGEINMRRASE